MISGKDLKNCTDIKLLKKAIAHKLHSIASPGREAEWQRDDGWEVSRWLLGFMSGKMISYHPKMW